MNKSEKIIVAILGLMLVGYFWYSSSQAKKNAAAQKARYEQAVEAQRQAAEEAQKQAESEPKPAVADPGLAPTGQVQVVKKQRAPEQIVKLVNDQKGARVEYEFSTWGATLKSATLLEFSQKPGAQGDDNPPFKLDFSDSPALALSGVPGAGADDDWTVQTQAENSVTFAAGPVVRTITLKDNYQLHV